MQLNNREQLKVTRGYILSTAYLIELPYRYYRAIVYVVPTYIVNYKYKLNEIIHAQLTSLRAQCISTSFKRIKNFHHIYPVVRFIQK